MAYKQCTLRQDVEVIKGWIPVKGAKIGADVEVKEREGRWTVEEVFDFTLSDEQLKTQQDLQRAWHNNI